MANTSNAPALSLVATGDIRPSRFIVLSTAADFTAAEANAGEFIVGISQMGTHDPPGTTGAGAQAARTGQVFHAYSGGQQCWLECGTTITRNDILKSDNDGQGVVATAGDKYGAHAMESGVSGDLIQVQVRIGELET